MKIILALIFSFVISSSPIPLKAQELQEYEVGDNKTNGAVANGEIVILNYLNSDLVLRCSYNKTIWKQQTIKSQKVYALTLPVEKSHLYVELCQQQKATMLSKCDVYKIPPKMRYVIKFVQDKQKVAIQKAIK